MKNKIGTVVGEENNQYLIIREIKLNEYQSIYEAHQINDEQIKVAVKFEQTDAPSLNLYHEKKVFDILNGGTGIPSIYWYGQEEDCNVLVMDLLGPSLEKLLKYCSGVFSIKTVFMIADKMIQLIEYIHRNNIIHRGLHPAEIVIGKQPNINQIYINNFEIARNYQSKISHDCYDVYKHIPYSDNNKPTGCVRYASINSHRGIKQSRRDDLETLGYILVYFSRGSLPWQGVKAANFDQKVERVKEIIMATSTDELCEGLPHLLGYLNYAKNLQFDETPDHFYIRCLLRIQFFRLNYKYDYIFDWMLNSNNYDLQEKFIENNNED